MVEKINNLTVACVKCKVASTCPRRGSSPTLVPKSKKQLFCQIIGGYGRDPIDTSKLSPDSLARSKRDGPCLTIAQVPTWNPDINTYMTELVKIFSQPNKHPRENVAWNINIMYPKGGGGT